MPIQDKLSSGRSIFPSSYMFVFWKLVEMSLLFKLSFKHILILNLKSTPWWCVRSMQLQLFLASGTSYAYPS